MQNPAASRLAARKGYSNGVAARGTMVFVAGEIGWDPATEKS